MSPAVIPGPLVLNVEALRNDAEAAARRAFGRASHLKAADVRVTAENQVRVCLKTRSGRVRWAVLLEPEGDISRIGILRFEFTDFEERS